LIEEGGVEERAPPRVGRRESEPHSAEINYLMDVLRTNFPTARAVWDLHHYFPRSPKPLDVQFDISFIQDFQLPAELSSYDTTQFGRIPDLAINVLSTHTWRQDFVDNLEKARRAQIKTYVVFAPYDLSSDFVFSPPFLRVHRLEGDQFVWEDLDQLCRSSLEEETATGPTIAIQGLPFELGLDRLSITHISGAARFRLVLVDPTSKKVFPTAKERADRATAMERQRADAETQRADALQRKAEDLERQLQEYQERFGSLDPSPPSE
jgi:Uma2 family endonuclease